MNRPQSVTQFAETHLLPKFEWLLIFFICSLMQINCAAKKPPVEFNGNYTETIDSKETFDKLKGEPLSDKYSANESIKIVYDVQEDKLYYVASRKYIYHYEFCTDVLHYNNSLDYFNETNYAPGSSRKYYLATLNYFTASGIYALEYVGTDASRADEIQKLYLAVKSSSFFGDEVKVLVNTTNLLNLINAKELQVPVVFPDAIFGSQTYQAVNEGIAYGYIKKIDKINKADDSIHEHDIIVIHENPVDIPYCTGIITTRFQTPLSHINILSHNRGTICFADITAWSNEQINALNGKLVKVVVLHNVYTLVETSEAEAKKFWTQKADKKAIKLKSDLSVKTLMDITQLNAHSALIVGSKAANLAELHKIERQKPELFKTPEGAFAIPFYFYHAHVQQKNIDSLIEILLSDTSIVNDAELLDKQLKKIRRAIKDAPLDEQLLSAVTQKILSSDDGSAYRFRSSTNAEDIAGFNGAGLYDSKTGIAGDSARSIADAIREVWASAYTYRAYTERNYFHIDERTVNMAILVHRAFPEEASNGVAITTNIYRRDFPGFVVNVQIGEISVVAPGDSIVCDQFICVDAAELNRPSDKVTAEYITFSNQNHGKPVLNDAEVTQLYNALLEIKRHFSTISGFNTSASYYDFAMDVEFKFDGSDHQLYIKQARPFN